MRVVLQRVQQAKVEVNSELISEIDAGLLLFTGISQGDRSQTVKAMAEKIANLRIFSNGEKPFELSILQCGFAALVVSQFTLFADTKKGRRPNFFSAAHPNLANELCNQFTNDLKSLGIPQVFSGIFGAHMLVSSINDGPVTINLEIEDSAHYRSA